ncbi:MAG: hypothetical protein AAF735_06670 [Myxococcota bacterium]
MSPSEELIALSRAMAQAVDHALDDGPPWAATLQQWGVAQPRLTPEQIAIACGFRPTQGAPPSEVRAVLGALGDASPEESEHDRRILAESHVAHYLELIRPKSTLGGIFANAAATSLRSGAQSDRVETRRCERCGAGRQKHSELKVCGFCGHPFGQEF